MKEQQFKITNDLIVFHLTELSAPHPSQTTVMEEDQSCMETVCQIPVWRGGGAKGSPGITAELRDKKDIVAETIRENMTSCPISSCILRT